MQPQFLSAEKAAEMLDIHPMTLKKKARSGEIPAGKSGPPLNQYLTCKLIRQK